MIIGLGHCAQSGKSTAGQFLTEDHGFTQLAFADKIRELAYHSNPSVRKLVDEVGWDTAKVVYPSVRKFLNDIGIAARQVLGENVWVDAAFSQMYLGQDYAITDVRFANEAQAILKHGGIVVKVSRIGVDPLRNETDQALAGWAGWSAEIHNDGSLDDLRASVAHLLATR